MIYKYDLYSFVVPTSGANFGTLVAGLLGTV